MIEIINYASIPPDKMNLDMNAVVFPSAQESPLAFHCYWTEWVGRTWRTGPFLTMQNTQEIQVKERNSLWLLVKQLLIHSWLKIQVKKEILQMEGIMEETYSFQGNL